MFSMNTPPTRAVMTAATVMIAGFTGTTALAEAPAPGEVSIAGVSHSGNGCPAGTVASNLSDDNKAMTLLFEDFIVASDEAPSGVAKKKCNVDIKLDVAPGWSYSLFCVDYRGFADLEEGVTGTHKSSYTFDRGNNRGRWRNQSRRTDLGTMKLKGPYADDYASLNAVPLANVGWSACNGQDKTLRIEAEIAVDNRGQSAQLVDMQCRTMGRPGRGMTYCRIPGRGEVVPPANMRSCRENRDYFIRGSNVMIRGRGCPTQGWKAKVVQQGATDKYGLMTVDSLDAEVKHHYGIAWRRCAAGPQGKPAGHVLAQGRRTKAQISAFKAQCARPEMRNKCSSKQTRFHKLWGTNVSGWFQCICR